MKKQIWAALSLLFMAASAYAQSYTLKYNIPQGTPYVLQSKLILPATMEIQGQSIFISTSMTFLNSYTPKLVTPDSIRMAEICHQVILHMDSPMQGVNRTIDTSKEGDNSPEAKELKSIINKELIVSIRPNGELISQPDLSIFGKQLSKNSKIGTAMPLIFPSHPIKIGESWTSQAYGCFEFVNLEDKAKQATSFTYTLKKFDKTQKQYTIAVSGTTEVSILGIPSKSNISGSILLDAQTCMPISSNLSVKIDIEQEMQGQTMKIKGEGELTSQRYQL